MLKSFISVYGSNFKQNSVTEDCTYNASQNATYAIYEDGKYYIVNYGKILYIFPVNKSMEIYLQEWVYINVSFSSL